MEIPQFNTRKELFKFLVDNKAKLEAFKRADMKKADAIICVPELITPAKIETAKAFGIESDGTGNLLVKVIINTTNIFDSHKDVHIPGLWAKSLRDNKNIMFLKNHLRDFEFIIAEGKELQAYTQNFTFSQLGYNLPGTTEALVFEALIRADRNEFMASQYRKGFVKNHSVGMQYVKLVMAVNDENYGAEYEMWEKYYPEIANKADADEYGYFWAVKEAKVIEGSAVPIGSNVYTPTMTIEESKNQPAQATGRDSQPPAMDTGAPKEPHVKSTPQSINYKKLIQEIKTIKL